ncbi:hypothetical protein [Mesoflavibacter zeaxanthinifaciens]|uniref:hypothetical protein n=1 Tax=Mesoflavibacter zeaxanthinifaciens TaxID=393060 RepID=UPI003A90088C
MSENATFLINEIAAQKKKISSEVWFGCVWGIKNCKTAEDYIERKKAIDSIIKLNLCLEEPLDFKFNSLYFNIKDDIKKLIKEDKQFWTSIIDGDFEQRNK